MDAPPTSPQNAGLQPGAKLGKFEVLAPLARGGWSELWKGHDPLLGRPVAIKHLIVDIAATTAEELAALRERFRQEAAILKALASDARHLVQILDFLDEPRGLFIVTEFVEGLSLAQLTARLPEGLESRQALGIVAATALALQTIHAAGVVHRDLKPSNILLPLRGGLKVCDFGLAAMLTEQDMLTVGTVRYMAPELFRGGPVDGRADIYSLGMIAYEMLAGRARFDEAFRVVLRDERNQAMRWLKWHTNLRAAAPPLLRLRADVPPALGELVARMMEKDPAQRIESAGQLLAAIGRHFSPQGAVDVGASIGPATAAATLAAVDVEAPTAPLPRPARLPLLVSAGALVLALAAAAPWVWSGIRDRSGQRQALALAAEEFGEARDAFRHQDYEQARTRFELLLRDGPADERLVRGCRAYLGLCDAIAARDAGRHDEALLAVEHADALAVLADRDLLQQVRRSIEVERAFEQEVSGIDAALAAGDVNEARRRLREQRQRRHGLSAAQERWLEELGARIEGHVAVQYVERTLAAVRELVDANRLDDAMARLAEAVEGHHSEQLEQELARLRARRRVAQLVAQADAAEHAGLAAAAVEYLAEALGLGPDEALTERLRRLSGQVSFEQGQGQERAGDLAGARQSYVRAAGFGNAAAAAALTRLRTADQVEAFVSAAEAAAVTAADKAAAGDDEGASREFEVAIEQYRKAVELGAAAPINAALRSTQVRLELHRGATRLKAGDIDAAGAAYERALAIDANDLDARQGLAQVQRHAEYRRVLAAGDEARRQSNFRVAKRAYRQARQVLPTAEIEQRLDNIEYEHQLALARDAVERLQWVVARAHLLAAARIHDTPEVRTLLDEASAQVEDHEPAEHADR